MLPRIKSAYEARELSRFRELTALWLDLMTLLEDLAATDPRHLLGRWIAEARSWGASPRNATAWSTTRCPC
ncbi:hypothetical protein GCM10020221_04630 [Streptomyces thioluteus]|uniref:Alpha-N-acetylglucosaminidase C-terminal domain-containing protein n=1 Tax=Streptomyces thioluteus TaxID=66431 RepID=A0ABN3WE08_STRTU